MLGDNIRKIRAENKLSLNKLSKISGVSVGYISDLENNKRSNVGMDILQKIADALNVSVNDFFSDNISNVNSLNPNDLNKKDQKDIAKDLDDIMNKLTSQEDGPLYYNGDELEYEDKELFKDALELALKTVKLKNKKKYTPTKYKK